MEEAPKPVLLMLGQIFSLVSAAITIVLLIAAPFDAGSYSINGESVSGPEFMRRVGWIFGLYGVLLGSIGVGLLNDATWTRPLMVAYWVVVSVSLIFIDTFTVDAVPGMVMMLVAAGIAWWYLYQKPNVRAYFESRDVESSTAGE